jgi:hypothetical protein
MLMAFERQRAQWSLKVETAEQARKAIRDAAMGFYAVAGIQAVVAIVLGVSMLWDAAVFAGLGFWLHRRNSRVAAVLLLVDAGIGIVVTGMNQFGGGQGGRNVVLALIVFWAALKAVIATFKLPTFTATTSSAVAST